VRVPTVYSKSHWVARGLSPRELARAFDLPNTISQHLAATFSAHRKALPFLLAPPAKVLHAVGSYLLAKSGGGRLQNQLELDVVPCNPLTLKSLTKESSLLTEAIDDENVITSPPPYWISNDRETPPTTSEDPVARVDDAAIPFHIWDSKIWALNKHCGARLESFKSKRDQPTFCRKFGVTTPCPLTVIRHCISGKWLSRLYKEFVHMMCAQYGEG
jgi:hypothetical protein